LRGSALIVSAKKSGGSKKGGKKAAADPASADAEEDLSGAEGVDIGGVDVAGATIAEATEGKLPSGVSGLAAEVADGEAAGDASTLMPPTEGGRMYEEEGDGDAAQGAAEGAPSAGAFNTAVDTVRSSLANPAVKNGAILGLAVLAGSFALSCYKVYMKYNSSRSKRKRQVNKNVVVVERLRDFFPDNRDSLTKGHIRGLQGKTGFKPEEIFRKYMRYKLNEEVFNVDFVADVLALKTACDLDDGTMAAVLLETGERMVRKYGVLMRDVSEMGASGMQRKVDGCAMFTKVMYLADLEQFISRTQGDAVQQRLKEIFGATDEDYAKLRITALGAEKMDISVLEAMITQKAATTDGDENKGGGNQGGDPTPA